MIRVAMEGPDLESFDFDTAVEKRAELRNRRISAVSTRPE